MKKYSILVCCLVVMQSMQAQVSDPKQTAENNATNRVNSNESNGINNGLNKAENGIKGLFKKKSKDNATTTATQPAAATTGTPSQEPGFKTYNNYDFVPGDTVLFEDHFADDQDGEFPSHWDLKKGQAVLNKMGNELAFLLTDGNYCGVLPLMKSPAYLTANFTIEYDIYSNGSYPLQLWFYPRPKEFSDDNMYVKVDAGGAAYEAVGSNGFSGALPADLAGDNFSNKWHHIALAFKKQQLKVYVDQYRVLVVPHIAFAPVHLDIESIGDQKTPVVFKNFRIASGGNMNMLGKKFTEAKIITHGINFDIDKATIKPESMGTLNMVVQVLKDNPDLKFEIDGHTDNSGTAAHNLTLSQQRAEAVKTQLQSMGIDASRLSSKGFGDSKPISDNNSMEGKANNRRVEFVRL